MPPIHVKDSGTIKQVSNVYVKDSGTWKQAIEVWNYSNGSWSKTYALGDGISISSSGYNSLTGITYTTTLNTATTAAQRNGTDPPRLVSVPTNATYVDFFVCGGGGAGGSAPQNASSEWIGSGGAGAPIIYGRLPIDPNDRPTHLECWVGEGASGRDTDGQGYLGRESALWWYTQGSNTQMVLESPGGMGGRPGDGQHKRIMYQAGIFELLIPISYPGTAYNFVYWQGVSPDSVASNTSTAELGRSSTTTVDGAKPTTSETDHTAKKLVIPGPEFGLRSRSDGNYNMYLSQYVTGSNYGDLKCAEEEADSVHSNTGRLGHERNLVWVQNTGWKFRYYSNSTFATGFDLPLDTNNSGTTSFNDTSSSSPYAGFAFSLMLPEPPERATGYAGTFRGETDSTGVPQNESFSRTSGALGTGTSLTGWSGTAPERLGGSNGTNYGKGGDGRGSYSATGNGGTDGIIQLKFGS